jgi:hypothetical protein
LGEISYEGAGVPVRRDLPEAHARAWRRLAEPGAYWSGAERVAIAAEVRLAARCQVCAERKRAFSASLQAAPHDTLGVLSPPAVDVIHRVTTDPRRLTRTWFDKTLASGVSEGQYVELIAVVATVISIDAFCRGVGVRPHPLPEPIKGEPSGYRPESARLDVAWVPMIPARGAVGAEADLWAPGRTANVVRALSLVPDEVRTLKDLGSAHYMPFEKMADLRAGRSLDRRQIELLAGRVSALRECFY